MDIEKIKHACTKLIGMHDFRNFCKKDESFKSNIDDDEFEEQQNFIRRIYNFTVEPVHINA